VQVNSWVYNLMGDLIENFIKDFFRSITYEYV